MGAGVVVVGSLHGGQSPSSRVCHWPPGMHITPNMLSQVAPGRYVLLGLLEHLEFVKFLIRIDFWSIGLLEINITHV